MSRQIDTCVQTQLYFCTFFFQPKYKPGDIPHYDGTESDDGSSYVEDQSEDRFEDFEDQDSKNSSSTSKPTTTTSDLATQKNNQEISSTKLCKLCNVDFGQQNDLKRHLKKVHT